MLTWNFGRRVYNSIALTNCGQFSAVEFYELQCRPTLKSRVQCYKETVIVTVLYCLIRNGDA